MNRRFPFRHIEPTDGSWWVGCPCDRFVAYVSDPLKVARMSAGAAATAVSGSQPWAAEKYRPKATSLFAPERVLRPDEEAA